MRYESRPNNVEQGWRALLAKVITKAVRDARLGNVEAVLFLYSDGCGDLLNFFIQDFNPNMIDKVLLSGKKSIL